MREETSPSPAVTCRLAEAILYLLGVVLLVFGFLYLFDPTLSISSINGIAVALGLHLPLAPTTPPEFSAWLGFTFAYMMAAAACAFLAAHERSRERFAYLNVLLVLKGTSSLTGIAFFVTQQEYPFYLATFLIDGLLFVLVVIVRQHLVALDREDFSGSPRLHGHARDAVK